MSTPSPVRVLVRLRLRLDALLSALPARSLWLVLCAALALTIGAFNWPLRANRLTPPEHSPRRASGALSPQPVVAPAANEVGQVGQMVTTTSAASVEVTTLTPGSLATAYGENLAAATEVTVNGRPAVIFFVSSTQINYLIPPETELGTANIEVRAGNNLIASGTVIIGAVAPAVFTFSGDGQGIPVGYLVRAKDGGQPIYEEIAQYDAAAGRFVPKPINPGSEDEHLYLVLFLTGVSHAADENGDGNANETVRLILGGDEITPLYAGAQGGLLGLDQLNVELPRSLGGRGLVNLSVTAAGATASNLTGIEVAAPPLAEMVVITDFITDSNDSTATAGRSLEIRGSGFSLNKSENTVLIGTGEQIRTAPVTAATANQLTVSVPFGVASGPVSVSTTQAQGVSPSLLKVRTSISGFVQEFRKQDNQRVGIKNIRVVAQTLSGEYPALTTENGSFVVVIPEEASFGQRVDLKIDPTPSGLPFPAQTRSINSVTANRDNQYKGDGELANIIELKRSDGSIFTGSVSSERVNLAASAPAPANRTEVEANITTGQVTLETNNSNISCPGGGNCNLTLTVLDAGRTPSNLPVGYFSSTIAQITPFGATFTPGGKLTFPNTDNIPIGTPVQLFKFDQTPGRATLGNFIDVGAATVTADGQRIETAADAVKEGSYYFVSSLRPTATLFGHVVESDGRPVHRAIVQARGQSTFTDGNGGFVLRNVPMLSSNEDRVTLEVSFQRANGQIARTQRAGILVTAGQLLQIVLQTQINNSPPLLLVPASLTMNEGEVRDLIAVNLYADQTIEQLTPTGVSFATIINTNNTYAVRLAPGANTAGTYSLTITATNNLNLSASQTITVTVNKVNTTALVANSQTVETDEDVSRAITLTGSNPGGGPLQFQIVSQPSHGKLSGIEPNLTYTPDPNYFGTDSFNFRVSAGATLSNVATVFIAIRPVNDAPVLAMLGPQSLNADQKFTLTVSAQDLDTEQILAFTASNLPPGASFAPLGATSYQFSWTPTTAQVGAYTVGFSVTDDGAPRLSDSRNMTLTVGRAFAQTSGFNEGGKIRALLFTESNLFAGTFGNGIFISTDNGKVWAAANNGLTDRGVFVRALTISGRNLFAGTDGAGVYLSTNNGQSWTAVNNGLTNLHVTSFAAPEVASGSNLFAATDGAGASGAGGIYRSTNNGQSWTPVNTGLANRNVLVLAVSGNNLFAGTDGGGVFRSTDNGQNWVPVGLANLRVLAFKTSGNILFAGTEGGVFRSTDNGLNWAATGLANLRVWVFEVNANNLFAGTDGGVYRSTDNGLNWTLTNTNIPQGVAVRSFTASPVASGSNLFAGTEGGGVYRSTDNGLNWTPKNNGLANPYISSFAAASAASGSNLFVGTDSGVYLSTKDGQSWTPKNNGLTNRNVLTLKLNGNDLFAGTGGSGVFRSADNGQSWAEANVGLPAGARVTAFEVSGSNLFAGTEGGGVFRSTNNGQSWTAVNNGLTNLRVTSFAAPPVASGSNLFVATDGGGIFRSTNNGQNWTPVNDGLTNRNVKTLKVSGNNLFAGTEGGGAYFSSDDGKNWTAVNTGLPEGASVAAFEVRENDLFTAANGAVYLSTNNGQSWTAANAGLANRNVTALVVSRNNLLVGTGGAGVYLSTSSNQNWSAINSNLAQIGSNGAINTVLSSGEDLYLGTLGSGVFRSADEGQHWVAASAGLPPNSNIQSIIRSADGALFAATFESGVYRSDDQGQSWTEARTGLPQLSGSGRYVAVNSLLAKGTALFAATDGPGIYRSLDQGQSWSPSLPGLKVITLALQGGTLYAGTDGDGVFISANDGQSWTSSKTGLTALDVRAFGFNDSNIFAGTVSGGIFRSSDGGQNWTALKGDLPQNLSVFSFAASGKKLFAGTIYGVFLSENKGESWQQINAGLLDIYVASLAVKGINLIAGTRTGGVFSSLIPSSGVAPNPEVIAPKSCTLNIVAQPSSQTIASGQTVTLNAIVSGNSPLQYKWYQGPSGDTSTPITSPTMTNPKVGGLTESSFTTLPLTATTKFWVRVSNACESKDSNTATISIGAPMGHSISGTINYGTASTPKPVPGVMLTAAGTPSATATTDSVGNYSLTGLGSGPYTLTPTKTGAANGISSQDAALVARSIVGLVTLTANQQIAADASGDGKVGSFDASLIAQAAVGMANTGIVGTWKFVPPNRSYASLSGNQTNQNFEAILVGDVSGNWVPAASALPQAFAPANRAIELTETETPASDGHVTASLGQISSATGSSVTIPVSVGELTGRKVFAYDLTLNYDPSVLLWQGAEASGTLSESLNVTVNAATPGKLLISAFGISPLTGVGTLLNLNFKVIGASGASSALGWESCIFNEGEVSVRLDDGRVTVSDSMTARSILGAASKLEQATLLQYGGMINSYLHKLKGRASSASRVAA